MEKEWLQKKITVAEAEAEHLVSDPRLGPVPVPFGFQNERWRAFLAKMQAGDELWTFSSSDESWQHLCGRAGISLVRNGEIVDSIVTLMN
jgi:hypothetical protein